MEGSGHRAGHCSLHKRTLVHFAVLHTHAKAQRFIRGTLWSEQQQIANGIYQCALLVDGAEMCSASIYVLSALAASFQFMLPMLVASLPLFLSTFCALR